LRTRDVGAERQKNDKKQIPNSHCSAPTQLNAFGVAGHHRREPDFFFGMAR
jgi:hypothetical protein